MKVELLPDAYKNREFTVSRYSFATTPDIDPKIPDTHKVLCVIAHNLSTELGKFQ